LGNFVASLLEVLCNNDIPGDWWFTVLAMIDRVASCSISLMVVPMDATSTGGAIKTTFFNSLAGSYLVENPILVI
jgi:hypothetical protein